MSFAYDDLPRTTCPSTTRGTDGRWHAQVVSIPTFAPWSPRVVIAVSVGSYDESNEGVALDHARELLAEVDRS